MATLTGQKIRDTYDGLLKTEDSTTGLPATGKTTIEDGLGNDSALKLGRTGNGVEVDSDFDVTGNLGINGESQFDQYANFDGDIEAQSNLDVYGTLNANDQFVSRGIQDNSDGSQKRVYVTSTGVGINQAVPDRPFHVNGNSRFNGNILADKSTSKIGIRRNDPQAPLDVNGQIRSKGLKIGLTDGVANGGRLIFTQTSNGVHIGKYIMFDQYGQGNFRNIDQDRPVSNPKYTMAFSPNGVMLEDREYFYVTIKPSFYQGSNQGEYKEVTLVDLSQQSADSNTFYHCEEILVIDNKATNVNQENYPPVRGNFVGPDEDPWISFANESGAFIYDRQIGYVPLGTYRIEDKKWAYRIDCSTSFQTTNDYRANVQRSGNKITMKVRALNPQTIRPNYDVLVRLTLKKYQPNNEWSSNPDMTLS